MPARHDETRHDGQDEADEVALSRFARVDRRRLGVALGSTMLALPIVVVDNLPGDAAPADVATVVPATAVPAVLVAAPTTVVTVTLPPTTTAPPTTAAPTTSAGPTAPPTTAAPTTAPPTTAAPTTTTTTAPPPTTVVPAPPPPVAAPPTGNTESGQASWYYWRPNECAHRTIAKGTVVTVTNVATGGSTTCTVTDRGPYGEGRIIDLDRSVFERLAPLSAGVINVTITW